MSRPGRTPRSGESAQAPDSGDADRELLALARQCDAARRRLEVLAERTKACQTLDRTPTIFARRADHYAELCDYLRSVAAGPGQPESTSVDGKASSLDAAYREVMGARLPNDIKAEVRRLYSRLRRGAARRRSRLSVHHTGSGTGSARAVLPPASGERDA